MQDGWQWTFGKKLNVAKFIVRFKNVDRESKLHTYFLKEHRWTMDIWRCTQKM